jgi:arylformamidase
MRLESVLRLEAGDEVNLSRLDCDVHTGTHIDAPRHFLIEGATVDQLPLETLIGEAWVAHVPDAEDVSARTLDDLDLPRQARRLLLRTRNSEWRASGETAFREDYAALTRDAAEWVVHRRIRLVGIDYLSIQRYRDPPDTHRILLRAGVVIVEGLNLAGIPGGRYELICLPLRLVGAEGAPARAALRRWEPGTR